VSRFELDENGKLVCEGIRKEGFLAGLERVKSGDLKGRDIVSVEIKDCEILEVGKEVFVVLVEGNNVLREIRFEGSSVTDKVAIALYRALVRNISVVGVEFGDRNYIRDKKNAENLEGLLQRNKDIGDFLGEVFDLDENDKNQELVRKLRDKDGVGVSDVDREIIGLIVANKDKIKGNIDLEPMMETLFSYNKILQETGGGVVADIIAQKSAGVETAPEIGALSEQTLEEKSANLGYVASSSSAEGLDVGEIIGKIRNVILRSDKVVEWLKEDEEKGQGKEVRGSATEVEIGGWRGIVGRERDPDEEGPDRKKRKGEGGGAPGVGGGIWGL
jgi:hypothetical protein